MSVTHLNQVELAARWKISPRTLERWRWSGVGPRFIKLGGRVVYRLEDIESFEAERTRSNTIEVEQTEEPSS
jgi:predicted site-specific integrase-resolvase